jgi:hypothetical protein
MFSVYFTRQGFISIEALLQRERFNSAFFTLTILPSIVGSVSVLRPKMRAQGQWLHIDNAKSHKAALSFQKTEEARSLYCSSHPIPMTWHSATFVFGHLKKELEERSFRFENEMISVVKIILEAITIGVLSDVFG